jgi:hypothetical protein
VRIRFIKTLNYRLLSESMLVAGLLLTFCACSRTEVKKIDRTRSPNAVAVTPRMMASDPMFQHGYGQSASAFSLVDQLSIARLKDNILANQNISEDDFERWRADSPSLIYTGRLLALQNCSDLALTKSAPHLAELWTQDYLLKLYSGPQVNWFFQAMKSLEERDPGALIRPRDPVHHGLVTRLGKGINPNLWALNAVRIRITDRATLVGEEKAIADSEDTATRAAVETAGSDGLDLKTASVPSSIVAAQIKLNYELDMLNSESDETIRFAAMIYSIAISSLYINEFILDVLQLDQNPATSGCSILRLLNKWVRNEGLAPNDPPRSSFFFAHSNILDRSPQVDDWRFAEMKVVSNDYMPFHERKNVDERIKKAMFIKWAESRLAKTNLSGGGDPNLNEIDFKGMGELFEMISTSAHRRIAGPYETPVNQFDPLKALRITPMSFPVFVARSPFSDKIELATHIEPASMWFSGAFLDNVGASLEGSTPINLLRDIHGNNAPLQHPARRHEETWTCGQCHARQVGNQVQHVYSRFGTLLGFVPFLNFRHIGFGHGGEGDCNPMFGVPREFFETELSEYLLDIANGSKIHKSVIDYNKNPVRGLRMVGRGPDRFLDSFRCQLRRYDFIDKGTP